MSPSGSPVLRRVRQPAPMPADAFHRIPEAGLSPEDAGMLMHMAPDSPRMQGAAAGVAELAGELRPIMVETLSFLRTYEAEHLSRREADDFLRLDFTSHFRRSAFTIAVLRHMGRAMARRLGRPPRILDVGGNSYIRTALMMDLGPVQGTTGDLRATFDRGLEAAYEIIVCTEVLEHVSDPPIGDREDSAWDYNSEVRLTGVRNCLERLAEVLDRAGALFITTPNCLSLYVLRMLAERRPPCIYRPHYREFAPDELALLLRDARLSPLLTTLQFYLTNYDLSGEFEYIHRSDPDRWIRWLGDTMVGFALQPGAPEPLVGELRRYLEVLVRVCAPDFLLKYQSMETLVADVAT